ncbi:voltage-dependent T-type calcium channel subunit alpha-1H [Electrophorus electricus]|uniref:voltage-dependent T-type calcium channel subunit alpha-1H n=1 Tax=Electrophorus electricus TaxID=8005 RepID=UPI0015D0B694|nr:voltage-dependent T-type calcium channel subunit alpha-1H [Electrophorus electricus]
MTVGEGTEPTPWPDQGEVRLPIPAQCGGVQPEVENSPAGLAGTTGSTWESNGHEASSEDSLQLPHPSLAPVVFFCLQQSMRPRSWCLALVCSPWFERVSMLVILLNCVTLGMFQPCQDLECNSERCSILQTFDDFIFAFFAVEMVVKMVALGVFGPKCYLGDTWNRLDFFIVMAGMLEYSLDGHNVSFSAIRTVRVLRPLRAINRVPSMRILVTLLLDTLPMLGNVLLLCFFVFFIFGIVGVQLWAGLLRNRCFLDDDIRMMYNLSQPLSTYYRPEESDDIPFICSTNRENGMLRCSDVPPRREGGAYCQLSADNITNRTPRETGRNGCVNWNVYYNSCRASEHNPHNGAINFDNIGYAWIAIFQVITLEGWVDIMYYVMDAHSFYNFIYFIFLIIVGSFFMINLCLVVIATQFSETKQRENQLMREQRARFRSNDSTLGSLTEPGSCYEELLKYLIHLCRKLCRFLSNTCSRLCPWRRGRSSTPSNLAPGSAVNSPWSSKEKADHAREQFCYHCPQQCVGNGADTGALEMKTLQLDCECPPPKPAALLPLSASGLHTSYPTILPYTFLTRVRAARRSGHAAGVRGATQHGNWIQGGYQDAYYRPKNGAGLAPPTQAERPVCPVCGHEGDSPIDEGDPDTRPREGGANSCISVCIHCSRTMLGRIVDSKYFNRGIMIAILINTLSMGVEYHEQPAELTDVLEISNIVFTSLFALEMLLKLVACGLIGYISNPYNIFDLIIVIISVWEIMGQADGGLSVLRTFRLLRVLKLVRFLPALRRQLVVLMKTMDNVATFCMLLMLFIFIFSILGMHLFGCKFTLRSEGGDTVSDRKNFDSLLWAIVTVFQILTQEDWNVVLYNGMASTTPWAALYFVALMTFGNYVLFNLLVAILVEGFQAEGDASRSESDDDVLSSDFDEEDKLRELINSEVKMHTLMPISNGHLEPRAAMPPYSTHTNPCASPWTDVSHVDSQSRRSSNASNEHHDQRSLSSLWGSRRSSWNSLGHAPSLKRRGQSGEHESLLSSEERDSFDDDQSEEGKSSRTGSLGGVSRLESFDMPDFLQVPPMSRPYMECNGRVDGSGPSSPHRSRREENSHMHSEEDDDLDENWCIMLKKILEPYKPQWCREHEDWSFYLFSPQNKFRVRCQKIITHKMFDHIVLIFIFLNCITIALERPDIQPQSMERVFLSVSNYIFTVIFIAEMTVKVVAMGLYAGPGSYLQSSWNVLDGLLVFVSVVDILVSLASSGGNRILGILRVLRLLRTLRPLRVISRAPGLKLVVETLITSLRPIGNIVLICCAFFIVFGILGVQLFKGKFHHCEGFDTRNITNKSECLRAKYRWVRRKYNFDNLGQALMSLFVLSSKDGWVNIMYDGLDAVAVDQQPAKNHNPWMLLYFISFLLIVSFFVLNMFVGVVVENFHKCRQDQEEEEARLREEKRQRRLEKMRRKALQRPYYADYSPARLYIHTLCTSHYLDLFITVIIGINVLTMSVEHYNQPKYLEEALKYFNYVFTLVFVVEAILKLVAFGLRRFFKDRWNQLDLAIVLLSVMGITLEEIDLNASLPINPTIIRIMRVLRIARVLKLLKMATGMRALLDTVVQALPQVGNLGLLFMLLFFIYAALGVELFGKLECSEENPCEGLSRHATFENFGMAFLTLFRVSTGDNWNGIMKDTLRECKSGDRCLSYLPLFSPLYFVTFVLVAQFVLVNVVVAVLMKHLEESNKDAREEAALGAELLEELRAGRLQGHAPFGGTTEPVDKAMGAGSQCVTPEQSDDPESSSLLSVGKPCVSRMLSLPNDSYMFYPVKPGQWSTDLQLNKQQSVYQKIAGSSFSVSSQPCERGSLLQVPGATAQAGSASHLESLPQFHTTRHNSLRMLQRQEAIKSDSVDSVDPGSRDNLLLHCCEGFSHLKVPHLPLIVGSTPCLPQSTPPLPPHGQTASVQTNKHTYSQCCIPFRRPVPTQPTCTLTITGTHIHMCRPISDETDRENRQLQTSTQRKDSLQPMRRCYTLSPCVSATRCSNNQSQTSQRHGSGLGRRGTMGGNLRKYYSMDAQGFLAQPSCPHRHSIHGEELQLQPLAGGRGAHDRSASPVAKKEKMSPPCISIDPPTESDPPTASQESSTVLRRRAPSFESALMRESLDLPDTPLISAPLAQTEAHLSSCLPLPKFSFDQSDVSSLSILSELLLDSDQSSHSIHIEAQTESVGPISAMSHSSFRKKGLVRTVSSRDSPNEDSVA